MVNICNGIKSPRICYPIEKRNGIKRILPSSRKLILAEVGNLDHEKGLFAGPRFKDDDSVIARIESANQDEIQKVGWNAAVRSALIDCMMSDYYYTFEKDYGAAE